MGILLKQHEAMNRVITGTHTSAHKLKSLLITYNLAGLAILGTKPKLTTM
jgi:hypothetical protein